MFSMSIFILSAQEELFRRSLQLNNGFLIPYLAVYVKGANLLILDKQFPVD